MSIWNIKETPTEIIFVEHENDYQAWDIVNLMSWNYFDPPVQIPYIGCYSGYEDCLIWNK